jgi:transcriptional regulator with XRE-family HTH domain
VEPLETFAANVKRLRHERKLTQETLAEKAELVSCAVSSLCKYGMLWHAENWTTQAGVGVDRAGA